MYRLYVEAAVASEREIYLGFVLDRAAERVMVVASAAGGTDIEEIAANDPDSIVRVNVEPAVGIRAFEAREIAFAVGLDASLVPQAVQLMTACYRAFLDLDVTMLEINPLAVTAVGRLLALDAKMTFDDNALFRHQDVSELRDKSQEDPRERTANDRGLSYVGLEGDIGCIINGAGLAMATMDMIKHAGGEPANFLDIGGGASPERVLKAFRLVLSDENVKAVLVNIFAGINRCDWVAEGVVQALKQLEVPVPVVVRLSGTLGYEAASQLKAVGIGVSTSVGIGGDPINGSSFLDHLKRFEADGETEAIVIIGEIGGLQEAQAAHYARDHMYKPVVGYIAGLTAPKGRTMAQAGAIVSTVGESAAEKVQLMRECGVTMVGLPSDFGTTVPRVLRR